MLAAKAPLGFAMAGETDDRQFGVKHGFDGAHGGELFSGPSERRVAMSVEWQGDHRLLTHEKVAFEQELERLGLDPDNFLVEVRREPDMKSVGASGAIRYNVYITDVAHPEHETCKLHGGHDKDWIAQYGKIVTRYR